MNFKSKSAFTLAEMMVVMLILSIVTAASLPIITKRSNSTASVWQWASNGTDAYFGQAATQGAIVGSTSFNGSPSSKLLLNSGSFAQNHILFKQEEIDTGHLTVDKKGNISLGNSILGAGETSDGSLISNAITIGNAANSNGSGIITIGSSAISDNINGVAIGNSSYMTEEGSTNGAIALGPYSKSHNNNIAIGNTATANTSGTTGAVAIGINALVQGANGIYIGTGNLSTGTAGSNGIAIGNIAHAGTNAISIGAGSQASQSGSTTGSIAIGNGAKSQNDGIAIGVSAANNSGNSVGHIAIGSGSNAKSNYSIAIGASAKAAGTNSTAVGYLACQYATGANKTCIGQNSGPTSGSSFATDDVERVYIGGPSNYNDGAAVLEVHNPVPSEEESPDHNNTPTVVINGNLIVKGNTYMPPSTYYIHLLQRVTTRADSMLGLDSDYPAPSYSDRRLKNVGENFNSGLDKIRELNVYNFTFKKDKKKTPQVGVIAQDLQKVFPDAVTKDKKGLLLIRKEDMFYAMINSIKQLDKIVQGLLADIKAIDDKIIALIRVDQINSKKIKSLEAENRQLKTQNKAFEARLNRLENKVK